MFGIASYSIIPIKKEPLHRSETVNHLLFSDLVRIIDNMDEWLFIESIDDHYIGWCQESLISSLTELEFALELKKTRVFTNAPATTITEINSNNHLIIPFGCAFAIENKHITLKNRQFKFDCTVFEPKQNIIESIIECAHKYLNAPYLWGGKTIFGTDCSGFSQTVFRMNGIQLPRDAYQQAETGTTIDFISESKAGDLAFFDNAEGRITHVGIMLSNDSIIHASSYVKINKIDHIGIFDPISNKYTHNLRIIKRMI